MNGTGAIDKLADVTVLFALVLALALLVERVLEIVKSLIDVIDGQRDWYKLWSKRARGIADRLERRLRIFEYVRPEALQPLLQRVNELLLNEQGGYSGTALVLSGDLVRVATIRLGTKIAGMVLGVGVAFWLKVDFLRLWNPPEMLGPNPLQSHDTLAIIASGIAIGLGAGPVHKIITTLEKKQADRQEKEGDSP